MARRHRPKPGVDPLEAMVVAMGLDAAAWSVSIHFTKGALTRQRGVVVEVTNRRTGQSARESRPAGTKREARALAVEVARGLVSRLS